MKETYMTDALGGFGAKPRIVVDGVEWTFTVDCPYIISEMEQLCLQWARGRMQSDLDDLPDRGRIGTPDHAESQRVLAEFRARKHAGHFRPGKEGYVEFAETNEGRMSILLASLRPAHPNATYEDCAGIIMAAPEAVSDIVEVLGKAMRTALEKMKAAATRPTTH